MSDRMRFEIQIAGVLLDTTLTREAAVVRAQSAAVRFPRCEVTILDRDTEEQLDERGEPLELRPELELLEC